ncbi:MAG: ribbon-helix-helix protein, CopG family [Thermoplasmata archaeon]|jgi:Arc/MetJ-type ribon-helix-helix transcriptional regulator|nr:MAG: CopG family transcriptional regulator [Aciduliprofundum sp.]HEU12476.1 ribbon-helix-helix protein, CopG family [Euryarchaeota archaeon]
MSDNEDILESVRITIRISGDAYKKLDELVKKGEFKNMSEVIRAAIQEFIKSRFTPPNVSKIPVELPKTVIDNIEILIESGDAVNKEDLIRMAVRDYVNRRVKELLREKLKEEEKLK